MIIGHEKQVGYLDRAMRRGRMSHAYFFYGPERVGKRAVAEALAKALFCQNYRGDSIAGAGDECASCGMIARGVHPQVILLDLAHTLTSDKEDRKKIPIEDIQELKRRFSLAPVGESWRVAIIDGADTMSGDAADAFLKMLEEPGERTLFALIADSRASVLPTILSRAVPIGFSPVPPSALRLFVRAYFPREDEDEMLTLIAGRPGAAIRMKENAAFMASEKKMLSSVRAALKNGIPGALALAGRADEDGMWRRRVAHALINELRMQLFKNQTPPEYREKAGRIGRMLAILDALETTNVNPRLAMDAMAVEAAMAFSNVKL